MFWLYILKNPETGKFYIGSTNNLKRRLNQHAKGYTRTTRVFSIDTLVYKEEYDTLEEARQRERKLKSYKSKKYLEWLINNKRL